MLDILPGFLHLCIRLHLIGHLVATLVGEVDVLILERNDSIDRLVVRGELLIDHIMVNGDSRRTPHDEKVDLHFTAPLS